MELIGLFENIRILEGKMNLQRKIFNTEVFHLILPLIRFNSHCVHQFNIHLDLSQGSYFSSAICDWLETKTSIFFLVFLGVTGAILSQKTSSCLRFLVNLMSMLIFVCQRFFFSASLSLLLSYLSFLSWNSPALEPFRGRLLHDVLMYFYSTSSISLVITTLGDSFDFRASFLSWYY